MQSIFKHTQALALTIVLASTSVSGQTLPESSGALDAGFGVRGRVTTDFRGASGAAASVAIQPDGKIVTAGWTDTNGTIDFALVCYNSDGTLDTTFGTNGRATTDFADSIDSALSLVVQADRKIVAAGYANGNFGLARYNSNGTLDASFGTGGKVTTDFGGTAQAASVAIQPDGKIVAAGQANISGEYDFALARYNSNGTLDATFGSGGKVTTDFSGSEGFSLAQAFSVAIQPDGKIVAAGQAFIAGGSDFVLARYNSNGTLDVSFGTAGRVTTNFAGANDGAFSVALQTDGRIVAAGTTDASGSGSDFALARYNSNGTLDATFGSGGKVTTDFSGPQGFSLAQAFSVAIQPDGKIVAAGQAFIAEGFDFALARYNSNGTPDAGFGTGGRVVTDFVSSADEARSVVIQKDGKIVAAGSTLIGWRNDLALARYQ